MSLDGENIVVLAGNEEKFRIPLCNIENVVCFSYLGCSPALMGKCCENNIAISFIRPSGKFLARITGPIKGNVLLRKMQYQYSHMDEFCVNISKNIIAAKLYNSRFILNRSLRDHADKIDTDKVSDASEKLKNNIEKIKNCQSTDAIRGMEGESAKIYFSVFNQMIVKQKQDFVFNERSKRPPLDNVNAMLSYIYTILTLDIQSALESVGLDPYVGFLHTDRAGRASLALDMIEELRAFLVDRIILTMINLNQIENSDFFVKEGGGVIMTDEARKKILKNWQTRKNEIITHPIIGEKIQVGLIPYVQAQLMARYIRGDLSEYSPFLCR